MADKIEKNGTPAIVEECGNSTVYRCGKNAGMKKADKKIDKKEEGVK